MFTKIMKLILKSRFSWSYFLIIFVFVFYAFSTSLASGSPQSVTDLYYFGGILSFFSIVALVVGGLTMSKSDSEFLLISPVRRRSMASALYVGQYLYTGPLLLSAFAVFVLSHPYSPMVKLGLVGVIILLSTLPVSLNVNTTGFPNWSRFLIAGVTVLWIFSFHFGFVYSPVSILLNHVYTGAAASVAVTAVLLARSVYMLGDDDLAIKVLDVRNRNPDYKTIRDYSSLSPVRAIMMYGFSQFEIATRSNLSGAPTITGRRIKISVALVIFAAIAVAYGVIVHTLGAVNNPNGFGYLYIIIFATLYIGVYPAILMSGSTLPMERAWLSFTSMRPSSYMPVLAASKMLQVVLLLLPFTVVDVVLFFLGYHYALANTLDFLVYEPIFLGIFIAVNYKSQSYQITEEKLITSRFNASQFVLLPFMFLYFGAVGVSIIFPIGNIVAVPVLAAFVYLLFRWKGYWDRRLYKLIEKGYV